MSTLTRKGVAKLKKRHQTRSSASTHWLGCEVDHATCALLRVIEAYEEAVRLLDAINDANESEDMSALTDCLSTARAVISGEP